jgi:signal transduction histidine kinase
MKQFKVIFLFFSFITLWCDVCYAEQGTESFFKTYYLEDKTNAKTLLQVEKMAFTETSAKILNFGTSDHTFWIKLVSKGTSHFKNELLSIDQARFQLAKLYLRRIGQKDSLIKSFDLYNTGKAKNSQGFSFMLPAKLKQGDVLYLKLRPHEVFITKLSIKKDYELFEKHALRDIIFGIYTGIMLIMFVYNLFLFIVVRDRSYIFYVFYILFTWLAQISIQGYGLRYIWDAESFMNQNSVVLYSLLGLAFACLFTISFLNTKLFSPLSHRLFKIYLFLVVICLGILLIIGSPSTFILMQILTLLGAAIAMYASYYVYFKKHFKPAGFYLLAWSILLVGAILFVLKDYGVLPYNTLTAYLLQLSSAIEVMLLSFALADKINYFKKENETAQVQALNASLENQKLIKEQNIVLEKKVKERTEELESANTILNETLNNLKSTQSQLVDAEKMAALGQLTAGIAHEINNPINFVTSNVKPLQLDIDDLKDIIYKYEKIDFEKDIKSQFDEIEAYKKQIDLGFINNEITSLLSGISEGAKRTAEIIRSLRNFSRVDETDMKAIDINEGLLSTLVLIRNTLPDNLVVIRELGNLPKVECMPGKINQVFMNLVSNAVQAIKSKDIQADEEFLTIRSWYDSQQVFVSIKDSGTGMSEEVKHRIFEPFFTTKDIGEGTGLGLSIVFSIIEKHKGHIEVVSEVGKGTEFIITLHVNIP